MRFTWFALVAIALAAPPALHAQAIGAPRRERESRQLQLECTSAGAALAAGRQDPRFDWALRYITRCDETAAPALAGVWRRPPRDSASLRWLADATQRVRDERILEATLAVVRDDRRPAATRLAAMRVLATYANHAAYVPPGQLERGWREDTTPVLLLRGDAPAIDGQRLLPPDTPERVAATLDEVARRASPEQVRYGARVLRVALASSQPSSSPPPRR
ncbi:MAG TPA: hypothetical protein VNA89_00145 [Gemmatimonadaceae bacterium]|nr:hypothetical protein [Gemmatimonadaceae bacterium]